MVRENAAVDADGQQLPSVSGCATNYHQWVEEHLRVGMRAPVLKSMARWYRGSQPLVSWSEWDWASLDFDVANGNLSTGAEMTFFGDVSYGLVRDVFHLDFFESTNATQSVSV